MFYPLAYSDKDIFYYKIFLISALISDETADLKQREIRFYRQMLRIPKSEHVRTRKLKKHSSAVKIKKINCCNF